MPEESEGSERPPSEGAGGAGRGAGGGAHRAPDGGRGRWGQRGRWAAFKDSPYLPATVVSLLAALAAGLFAGTYTYAMANPTPHHIPSGVTGDVRSTGGRAFVDGMEKALNASLRLHFYGSVAAARDALDDQRVFAVLDVRPGGRAVDLGVSGASGESVAEVLERAGPAVGRRIGIPVRVTDVKPLQRGDPRGLAIFYVTLASVIIGLVGSFQLSAQAKGLGALQRILFTAGYALLGGFSITVFADWVLGAIRLPFPESWLILTLTMFTAGMVTGMFGVLVGRWAMLPTWGLMVIIGNPSSGGAVSWPLLPSVLGAIGRWLPPGASVNAQHTAVYFHGHQHAFPFLVLGVWAAGSTAVFVTWGRLGAPRPTTSVDGTEGSR
ncbi:ABC transporter permease [Streptomyces sp. TS71-3]|uniref:ABC transporter permease n=1 Tax=Streptomyces sp. TS71-3 TaxID=2733862 RepID=UPI001B214E46|nr:ABC transporter permease [Streptomyces sp. TS71-3]GHJ40065.1 hypothetical protein Sm713_56740 [Streptomyces sp. TS71-3]